MNDFRSPICFIRMLWRSLTCLAWVSGHDYEPISYDYRTHERVFKCETCGHRMECVPVDVVD